MLDVLAVLAGLTLVVLVFVDAFATTLLVAVGAGPFTRRLLGAIWRLLLRFHTQDKPSFLLTGIGTSLLITTVLTWVLVLWAGWTLVFLGSGEVVHSQTRAAASPADVAYFTGFTIFTLGVGDFVADTSGWRLVTAAASFSGLSLVTLAITYLISVVSAVVARRSLAIHVYALGGSAADIIQRGWTGDRFSVAFTQQLVNITSEVAKTAEQHLAYPALHYFHTPQRHMSAPSAIAALDDALLMLSEGVAGQARPDESTTHPLRNVIERFLTTASVTAAIPDVAAPRVPTLTPLVDAGIPVVAADLFEDAVKRESDRRTSLRGLVNSDGWSWPQQGGSV